MTSKQQQQFLSDLYDAFNGRDIETLLARLQPDVQWANRSMLDDSSAEVA